MPGEDTIGDCVGGTEMKQKEIDEVAKGLAPSGGPKIEIICSADVDYPGKEAQSFAPDYYAARAETRRFTCFGYSVEDAVARLKCSLHREVDELEVGE